MKRLNLAFFAQGSLGHRLSKRAIILCSQSSWEFTADARGQLCPCIRLVHCQVSVFFSVEMETGNVCESDPENSITNRILLLINSIMNQCKGIYYINKYKG